MTFFQCHCGDVHDSAERDYCPQPVAIVDRPVPTATPALDLDAVEAAPISDEQLSAWMAVSGAASPAALQYGPTRGDGRAFILNAYDKGPAGSVHAVWYGDPDDAMVVAVTGNGPTSEANAKHIAWSSPRNVAALIAEVRALRQEVAALSASAVANADETIAVCEEVETLRAKLAEAKRLGMEAHGIATSAVQVIDDESIDDDNESPRVKRDLRRIAAALEAL